MSQFVRSRAHPPYPPSCVNARTGSGVCACENTNPEQWRVTLEPVADPLDRPADVRLKSLLKIAGRTLGLRVVDVVKVLRDAGTGDGGCGRPPVDTRGRSNVDVFPPTAEGE